MIQDDNRLPEYKKKKLPRKKKYHQGNFKPVNPQRYVGNKSEIVYRSSWELKMMLWCDLNPSVVKWNSEGMKIPYWSNADQKQRTYWIDFIVQYKTSDGSLRTTLIEIKPEAETKPPPKRGKKQDRFLAETYTWEVNKCKWDAAKKYAAQNGMEFLVMNEYDLGIKKRK